MERSASQGPSWAGSDRRLRLPPRWPQLRRAVLVRDDHRCTRVVDGTRCQARATDVDHIVPGDDHSLANLTSLCRACHAAKSSAEGNAARRRLYPRRDVEPHPGQR